MNQRGQESPKRRERPTQLRQGSAGPKASQAKNQPGQKLAKPGVIQATGRPCYTSAKTRASQESAQPTFSQAKRQQEGGALRVSPANVQPSQASAGQASAGRRSADRGGRPDNARSNGKEGKPERRRRGRTPAGGGLTRASLSSLLWLRKLGSPDARGTSNLCPHITFSPCILLSSSSPSSFHLLISFISFSFFFSSALSVPFISISSLSLSSNLLSVFPPLCPAFTR